MPRVTIQDVKRYTRRAVVTIAGLLVLLAAMVIWAWQVRADIADTGCTRRSSTIRRTMR